MKECNNLQPASRQQMNSLDMTGDVTLLGHV